MSKKKNEPIEGYNPKLYRTLTAIILILMWANIIVIMFFFSKVGFGLYHAEAALSNIAKVEVQLEQINTDLLDIAIHSDDAKYINEKAYDITESFGTISEAAADFRNPKFDDVDQNVKSGFESAMSKVDIYERWVTNELTEIKNDPKNYNYDDLYGRTAIEKQDNATDAFEQLFASADDSTYAFFSKVGQSFLLIVFFLLFTMSAALFAVNRIKRKDKANALKLQQSNANTIAMREKAENIAYINIITGLKNRYAFDADIQDKLEKNDFSVALFNFNDFSTLNETQGRQFADEYIATISGTLTDKFKDSITIYSTRSNEFCVIFNNDMPKHKIEDTAWQMVDTLSRPTRIHHNKQITMTVSGCLYHYTAGDHKNVNSLFMSLDKGLNYAKQKSQLSKQNTLVPITK